MIMKKQTAVDLLRDRLFKEFGFVYSDNIHDELKEIEKEQMDKVSEDWFVEGCKHIRFNKRIYQSFEQYYTSTYE